MMKFFFKSVSLSFLLGAFLLHFLLDAAEKKVPMISVQESKIENKTGINANFRPLIDMIKHELGKAGSIPGMGGGQSASAVVGSPAVQGVTVSMPAMAAPVSDGASIDVSI